MGDVDAALLLEQRHEEVVDGVLVVRIVGADDAGHAGMTIEVLRRIRRARVLHGPRQLRAIELGEGLFYGGTALPGFVEVGRECLGEVVREPRTADGHRVEARELRVALRAQGRLPVHRERVVRVDDRVHLRDQAVVLRRHALALALIRHDLHVPAVQHVVLVDERLPRLVEHLGIRVGDERALGLEDGVDLRAVVGHVVDQHLLQVRLEELLGFGLRQNLGRDVGIGGPFLLAPSCALSRSASGHPGTKSNNQRESIP